MLHGMILELIFTIFSNPYASFLRKFVCSLIYLGEQMLIRLTQFTKLEAKQNSYLGVGVGKIKSFVYGEYIILWKHQDLFMTQSTKQMIHMFLLFSAWMKI